MKHLYKKHFINASDDYKIGYHVDNVFQKFVDEGKPHYVKWLMAENIPEEIPFVPAPPLTIEELKIKARLRLTRDKRSAFQKRIWEESQEYTECQSIDGQIDSATEEKLEAYIATGAFE